MDKKTFAMAAASAAALCLGGCVQGGPGAGPTLAAAQPAPQPGKWDMPWQLLPASSASEAQGERTTVREVAGLGPVRGTDVALTYASQPLSTLQAPPGRNKAVEPCREVVEKTSKPLGAVRVEATSAGPGRRTRAGYEAPVAFRVLYRESSGYEVRQSIMTCKLDRSGRIKDAYVPGTKGSYASLRTR